MSSRFLFDIDFEEQAKAAALKPEITYDQEELDIACRQSRMEGFDEGRIQALREIDADCRKVLLTISQTLNIIDTLRQESYVTAGLISKKVISVLFPVFSENGALIETQAVLNDILQKLNSDNHIMIHCSAYIKEKLQQYVDSITSSIPIVLHAQDDMSPSDIKVIWKKGFAERNEKHLFDQIETLMKNYTHPIEMENVHVE